MLYLRNICSLKREGAYPLSHVDDFAIIVTLNSAKSNCKKLEEIAQELNSRAKEAAISFNVSKTELIHFYSKRTTIIRARRGFREDLKEQYKFYLNLWVYSSCRV